MSMGPDVTHSPSALVLALLQSLSLDNERNNALSSILNSNLQAQLPPLRPSLEFWRYLLPFNRDSDRGAGSLEGLVSELVNGNRLLESTSVDATKPSSSSTVVSDADSQLLAKALQQNKELLDLLLKKLDDVSILPLRGSDLN